MAGGTFRYISPGVNIQQVIIEGLRKQLYHHEYIVLPGFGGFVLKSRAAHFSATGTQLLPPSKTVSFNAQLRQNDGILSLWLQKEHHFSAEEALRHLQDFANYCRSILDNRRRLTVPGIGFFYLDLEGNLGFEAQPDQNFLAGSFGLGPVSLPEIRKEEAAPRRSPVFEDRLIVPVEKHPARRKARQVLVPLLLVAVTGLVLAMLVSVSTFRGELRAALLGGSTPAISAVPYQPLHLGSPDTTAILVQHGGLTQLTIGGVILPVKASEAEASGYQKFEIVLGCFSKKGNANRLIKKLGKAGIDARISPRQHKGMSVVTSGSYPDKISALDDLVRAQAVVPEAWIKAN